MAQTRFETFLAEEISKVRGIAYPVKAGFLRRILISNASVGKLHPNPNDEFCFPDIGPNYEIMNRYASDYRRVGSNPNDMQFLDSPIRYPIEVEKIYPDGYMILNGHHRWGAAHLADINKIRIKIVDLTQESDVREMMRIAGSDQRVALDLDEVIFRPESDPWLEKPLRFPLNRYFRERLRFGIPALFHMLNSLGYDIWIYSANYYSLNYLRYFFKHYHVHVTGIVTGTARKGPAGSDTRKELETLLSSKYKSTVHISSEAVIRTFADSRSFDEFPLNGNSETWSRDVMNVFTGMLGINPQDADIL